MADPRMKLEAEGRLILCALAAYLDVDYLKLENALMDLVEGK